MPREAQGPALAASSGQAVGGLYEADLDENVRPRDMQRARPGPQRFTPGHHVRHRQLHTPPAGWQRIDQNGMVLLQATRTANGKTTYCQIFLFPSHPGAADAMQNFTAEWARLIAQPFGGWQCS